MNNEFLYYNTVTVVDRKIEELIVIIRQLELSTNQAGADNKKEYICDWCKINALMVGIMLMH